MDCAMTARVAREFLPTVGPSPSPPRGWCTPNACAVLRRMLRGVAKA